MNPWMNRLPETSLIYPVLQAPKQRPPPPKEKPDFGEYAKRLKRDLGILSGMYEEASPDLRRHLQRAFEASIYKADLGDLHKNRVDQLTAATNGEGHVQAFETTIPDCDNTFCAITA